MPNPLFRRRVLFSRPTPAAGGGGLPTPPAGSEFITERDADYITDRAGEYIVTRED